jgi:hypothetical protein
MSSMSTGCDRRFPGGQILSYSLISNFRRVLNIVCILLGISPAADCDLPTFRNPLSVPSSKAGCRILYTQPLKMELTEVSETSANHNLPPGKYPKEHIQYSKHGESLKSRTLENGCVIDGPYYIIYCYTTGWPLSNLQPICLFPHLTQFESMRFQTYVTQKQTLENEISFLKNYTWFFLQEWKLNQTEVTEEYCWAKTKVTRSSCYSRAGATVLEFFFLLQLDFLVRTCTWRWLHVYPFPNCAEFRLLRNFRHVTSA